MTDIQESSGPMFFSKKQPDMHKVRLERVQALRQLIQQTPVDVLPTVIESYVDYLFADDYTLIQPATPVNISWDFNNADESKSVVHEHESEKQRNCGSLVNDQAKPINNRFPKHQNISQNIISHIINESPMLVEALRDGGDLLKSFAYKIWNSAYMLGASENKGPAEPMKVGLSFEVMEETKKIDINRLIRTAEVTVTEEQTESFERMLREIWSAGYKAANDRPVYKEPNLLAANQEQFTEHLRIKTSQYGQTKAKHFHAIETSFAQAGYSDGYTDCLKDVKSDVTLLTLKGEETVTTPKSE